MSAGPQTKIGKLRDTSGASIVIALVFFLICAIIGSVVLTAASVNAKAAQTHRELQQAEYIVGSAAQTIGEDMRLSRLEVTDDPNEPISQKDVRSQFGGEFWKQYGATIMANRMSGKPTHFPEKMTLTVNSLSGSYENLRTVYGDVIVDADLNITVNLSLSETMAADSPYNMRVTLQCIPTYNAQGKLLSFSYEQPVVGKLGEVA